MADIRRLSAPDAQVLEGAITGRALYDGRIDSREALALLREAAQRRPQRLDREDAQEGSGQ
jgi:phosphoribosylformimino-5-aminoimidazole carboxamide ribotide isomerase